MQEELEGVVGAAGAAIGAQEAEALVIGLIGAHAESLLRVARRHSLCADDAQDAYQRGLEILLRHARRLDPDRAAGWLHTVVKHEAMAVRRSRQRLLGGGELDADALECRTTPSPEERVASFEHVARSAEALQRLKPQEVQAMWLKAAGNSYQQICETTGWTYTKVNRCLAEGRKSFLQRYAGIESGAECDRWAGVLSAMVDGEASAADLVDVRPHLRNCPACRATVRELRRASVPLAAVFPAAGLVLADGTVEQAGGLLGRLAEWVLTSAHERAIGSVMRAQAVLDTATAGKMAAVAASAAALAGGGAAAMHDATNAATPMPRAAAVKRAPAEHGRLSPRAPRTAVARTHPPAPSPVPPRAASQRHAHRPAPATRPQTEFIAETAATKAPASAPATHTAPSAGAAGTEFGLESP
jgi:RNA polymerase sigma factor (sigma-70 family)